MYHKNLILGLNLESISFEDYNSNDTFNYLKTLAADLFVVVAFKILPERIIKMPKYGSINLHPSTLPKYRGSSPIQAAILNGDKKIGVTIFRLNKKIDSGSIIIQKEHPIDNDIIFSDLYRKISLHGADLLMEAIYF